MDEQKRLFRTLAFASFFLYLGFNIWRAMFNNYAIDEFGVSGTQIGFIQSAREIPGLLGFVLGFLVLVFSEMRVMGLSVLLMGLGLIISGGAQNLTMFIVGTMVMSVGFHFFYPSNSSVVLMAVGKKQAPQWLGRLRSVSSFAAVLGTLAVWAFVEGKQIGPLAIPTWGYRTTLYVAGGLVIAGSLLALRNGMGGEKGVQRERRKVIFRRDYWLYYSLTFLMGIRRHIFTTFAIFMLVQVHNISVSETAILFLVNNVFSTFSSSLFGWLVARFGERKVLTVNFAGLIGVFIGYAFVPYLVILYALFVLDHIFFGFNLAIDSYFQKIAHSPDEITSNVSLAQTINHVSAIVVPILGGMLWDLVHPSVPFLAGVVIAIISLILVQFLHTEPALEPVAVPAE